jgi:hypothetical protein
MRNRFTEDAMIGKDGRHQYQHQHQHRHRHRAAFARPDGHHAES